MDAVQVHGLRDLQRGLAAASPELRRLLGKANKKIAEDLVAAPARRLAEQLGGGHVRLARRSVISARGTSRSARVALNAGRVPDAFGQEFGAKQFPQFQPWRGNQWNPDTDRGPGYVLHPTIRAARPRIIEEYADRLMDAMAAAFPERIR